MSPLLLRPSCTRFIFSSHPYSVQLSNTRVNQYSQSFIPGKLLNSLLASVFPSSYDLTSFKKKVSRYIPDFWITLMIFKLTGNQVGLFF
ncbi:hypothetical protein E2C01_028099 [Portunus trituberculatus]|uniref:Uncharacterized protein n=1 Tax=Portunus trituberculatus TaxID=210409 RepID=A0A5B7EJM2_PORTR|nr:hypothetical protein [Portunus trituberculatus]